MNESLTWWYLWSLSSTDEQLNIFCNVTFFFLNSSFCSSVYIHVSFEASEVKWEKEKKKLKKRTQFCALKKWELNSWWWLFPQLWHTMTNISALVLKKNEFSPCSSEDKIGKMRSMRAAKNVHNFIKHRNISDLLKFQPLLLLLLLGRILISAFIFMHPINIQHSISLFIFLSFFPDRQAQTIRMINCDS